MKTRQFAAHDMWGWFSSGTHLRKHVVFFAALLLSILICGGAGIFSVSALTDEEDAAQTNETIISETQTDDQKATIQTEEEQNEEYRVKIERIFEIVLDDGDSLRSKFHDE